MGLEPNQRAELRLREGYPAERPGGWRIDARRMANTVDSLMRGD